MTSKFAIALSASVLALAACGKKDTTATDNSAVENTMVVDNSLGGNAAETIAPLPNSAQGFANTAAASDKFEIESSKLAATNGQSAAVKAFATKMITAHEGSTAKLKTTVAGLSPVVTPDDTLSATQQQDLDNLKGLNGTAFDTAYAAAQVKAHEDALAALKAYSSAGDTPKLKDFANGLIPKVTAHLNMAKGLK
jgi:putative membrane protein